MDSTAVQRWVDLDGPVHYVEHVPAGPSAGPAVVCVHGLGGSHANWHDLGPLLAGSARVYALDLAGFGRTPRAGRSSSLPANRRLLSRFLTEVVGEPAVLVGNSMGGTLSLLQAAEEPATVRGLVLIGPAVPRVRREAPDRELARLAAIYAVPRMGERYLVRRRSRLGAEGLVSEQLAMTTSDPARVSQAARRLAVQLLEERAAGPDAEAAFLEAARSLVALLARPRRLRSCVRRVTAPTLLLTGREDRLVPLSGVQQLAATRPDWRLHVLDGVGHVPQFEVPGTTAALVRDWLDEVRAGADLDALIA
jgi:pimeloyl-ACP methyl ester carboxylesterase